MTLVKLAAASLILAAFAAMITVSALSCSSGLDDAPKVDVNLGQHPVSWAKDHWPEFFKKPAQCENCHGSVTDAALAGGVSKVSCFSCHITGVSHVRGFAQGSAHGRNAAQLEPNNEPAQLTGFVDCTRCHGENYRGGQGDAVSCMACHTRAPHPNRPWLGPRNEGSAHQATHRQNAQACARCHTDGARSTRKPAAPPEPGALPGCYNNTLCHARDFN